MGTVNVVAPNEIRNEKSRQLNVALVANWVIQLSAKTLSLADRQMKAA